MPGLSQELHNRCRDTLLNCSNFNDNASVRAIFLTDGLSPFRAGLPEADNIVNRVTNILDYLLRQESDTDGRPVLVIFLHALSGYYKPGDALLNDLKMLALEVERELGNKTTSSPLLDITMKLKDKVDDIEFIDRQLIIQDIRRNKNETQFWIIDAPAGYGKTQLIKHIIELYGSKNIGWVCLHLEISRESSPQLHILGQQIIEKLNQQDYNLQDFNAMSIGGKIADVLGGMPEINHKGIAIFIDNLEVLDDSTFNLLDEMTNGIYLGLDTTDFFARSNKLWIFLVGRNIRHRSIIFTRKKLRYYEYTLAPYTFQYVEDAVQKYTSKVGFQLESPTYSNLAARFMHFNGGHPGCIAEILTQLKDGGTLMIRKLLQDESIYREYTSKFLLELEQENKTIYPLLQILETLSIFRSFDAWLLKNLIDDGYITWEGDAYQLRNELTKTHLLHREPPGDPFIRDSITQRLFFTRLRYQKPEYFSKLCHLGNTIYWNRLCSHYAYPDRLAIEHLYQKLQYAYYVEHRKGPALREIILQCLEKTMQEMTKQRDRQEVFPIFYGTLENDRDLEFLTNYYIDDQSYNHGHYRNILEDFAQHYSDVIRS